LIIQITPEGFIHLSGNAPVVGKKYALEDITEGSGEQNRAFHALVGEYWKSGAHSYPAKNFDQFRDYIKRDLGAGFESYVYASPEGIKKVDTLDEIPAEYRVPPYCLGKLKSWSKYTKKQRTETIDKLISEMHQAGVNTKKFQEILQGMEGSK